MNKTTKLLAAVLVVALAAAVLPMTTTAQNGTDVFGSQVVFGDSDFVPTLDAPFGIVILRYDGGTADSISNDLFFLQAPQNAGEADIQQYDILVARGDQATQPLGYIVQSGDVNLIGRGEAHMPSVVFADINENDRYDPADWVFITTGGAGDLPATAAGQGNAFSFRLTDTDSGDAGSLVRTGHTDRIAWGPEAMLLADAAVGLYDATLNDEFRGGPDGDRLYIVPDETDDAIVTHSLVPLGSVRVHGETGDFGTQVVFGDPDFVPTLTAGPGTVDLIRYDGGTSDNINNDMVFLKAPQNTGDSLEQHDVLVARGANAAHPIGYVIQSGDVNLIGRGDDHVGSVMYADVNENDRYDPADWLFVCNGAAPLTATVAGEGNAFCFRLTDTDAGAAGSFVRTGQPDLITWGPDVEDLGDAMTAFYDADLDGDFRDNTGDRLYITPDAVVDGDLVPLGTARVVGDTGDFGSQVEFGDPDFIPLLAVDDTDVRLVRYDGGTSDSVDNDMVFLKAPQNADGTEIEQYDILVARGPNAAFPVGHIVQSGDVNLLGRGSAVAGVELLYADVNENGRYDPADWVYACGGGHPAGELAGTAAGEASRICIRLTDTDSGDAGSLVRTGQMDLIAWRLMVDDDFDGAGAVPGVAFYDGDLSEAFRGGSDRLYITPDVVVGGDLVLLGSIRVFGDIDVTPTDPTGTTPTGTDGPDPTDPTDPTGTDGPEPTPTVTETVTVTPTPPTTPDPTTETVTESPDPVTVTETPEATNALGLLALVAALGAALYLVRRKD